MIALIGNLSRDLLPGRPPQTGGGPFHGARALHRLRVPARIFARCAEADRAVLFPPLVQLGTPTRYVHGQSTNTFSFSYNGDVRTMSIDALGDVWQPADLPELPTGRWVHVAPLARGEFPLETIAALARIWVLKLADEEAEVLGDPAALGVREVLVTHGSRGSTIYYGGKSEHVPAHAVGTDPTGAGDAYATAYIVARNAGFAPAGAARRATAVVASMLAR